MKERKYEEGGFPVVADKTNQIDKHRRLTTMAVLSNISG